MASTRPIAPIDEVMAAKIDVKALATAEEALIEGIAKNK